MTDTQWNDDDPMDARLRDLANEYNRPTGVVPREAMWQAIAPTVRAAAQAPDIAPAGTPSITRKRRTIAPFAWSTALAAGLVLGIMLEREVLAPRGGTVDTTPRGADSRQVATTTPIPMSGATVVAKAPDRTTQVATMNTPQVERRGARATATNSDARSAPRAPTAAPPGRRYLPVQRGWGQQGCRAGTTRRRARPDSRSRPR